MPERSAAPPVSLDAPAAPRGLDADAVRERFERLSAMFAEMMPTVEDLSRRRCPYKNRLGECTASFGCRNQRRPVDTGGLRICGGDDRLDYRSAWETK